MAGSSPDAVNPDKVLYCTYHPKTQTLIRCSKCLDPICLKCAIRTPVGLRCPKCAKVGHSPLYALEPQHYVLAGAVALVAATVAGAIMVQLGVLFALFLGVPVGGIIAEAVTRSIHGRRGRAVQAITAVSIALGALLGPWLWVAASAGTLNALPANALGFLGSLLNVNVIIYAVLAVGAAIARLR
jgi:hypothetical protein